MTWQNAGSLAATNGNKNFVGTSTLLLGAFVDDALFYTSGTTIWLSDIASITDNTHIATQDNWPFTSGTIANGNWGIIPCSPLRQTTATLNAQIATLIGQYSSVLSLSASDNYATFNKALAANNNGVYFTTAGAAVARMGTFGDNQLRLSVSPSGGGYTDALVIDRTTALATLAGDPTAALGIATKQYVDGANTTKLVRAASTTNITISSPGASIGGVTPANGERYLLAGQTTASQNGIYVYNGASSAMTRATDADGATKLQPGIAVSVSEGTFAGHDFTLTTAAPLVIGTTALTFTRSALIFASVLQNYLTGLTLSAAGSTATFGIAAGGAMDSANVALMNLASAYTKTTGTWALGSGVGALDTGSVANSTWYHVWLIQRSDTGVVDVLISTSATSPTMPTNYDRKRRIGSMLTDGSAQWKKFFQNGDKFIWDAPASDVTATNPGTSAILRTLSVAPGVRVDAFITVTIQCGTAPNVNAYFSSPDVSDLTLNFPSVHTLNSNANYTGCANIIIPTNASGQVRSRIDTSSSTTILNMTTTAWLDRRGRDG